MVGASPLRRLALRTAFVLAGIAVAALVAEGILHVVARKPYAPPRIVERDETTHELYDIVGWLQDTGKDGERPGPHSVMGANIVSLQCYDRPEWDYFDEQGCVELDTNSLGFRDLEFPVEKPPGELRILAVGDSFTFGLGVRLEDTWVQQLERMLRATRAVGSVTGVEVINGGFAAGGHRPADYAGWIEHDGLAFAPELLIIGFCLNDMGTVPMAVILKDPPDPWLGGRSLLLARLQSILHRRRFEDRTVDVARRVERTPGPWLETQAGLQRIRDVCAARGVRLVVAVFPMLSFLDERYPYHGLHRMVAEFCEREGIERVDLLERFLGRRDTDLWVHPTDQHPNDVGHRLIAEGIDAYLAGEKR